LPLTRRRPAGRSSWAARSALFPDQFVAFFGRQLPERDWKGFAFAFPLVLSAV
jgi:hypothetical protein